MNAETLIPTISDDLDAASGREDGKRRDPASTGEPTASVVAVATPYDEVPYPSYPFAQTHPARLATIATLFGMQPAPVDRCRVLELGCASGGNLIPMADVLPQSTFVGIDASQRQIAEGKGIIDALALKNIDLRCQNILDVGDDLGEFDYIICHGVYSWVPEEVQDKILAVCKRHLAPQGVAYVSYNTYPGWHMRGTIRDMMSFHASKFDGHERQAVQARKMLDFVAQHVPASNEPYAALLKQEANLLRTQTDEYLIHEHLEETNEPCYFYQFARAAEQHELQYLGEADICSMILKNFNAEVTTVLRTLAGDFIELEQYMDFLRNRTFRQTIVCHRANRLDRRVSLRKIAEMHVASSLIPQADGAARLGQEKNAFLAPDGRKVSVASTILSEAIRQLHAAHPCYLRVAELYERASAVGTCPNDGGDHSALTVDQFASELFRLYGAGFLKISVWPPPSAATMPGLPRAMPLARHLAGRTGVVPNWHHELATTIGLERHIMTLLDGKTSIQALIDKLIEWASSRRLIVRDGDRQVIAADELSGVLRRVVPVTLERLRRLALIR